MVQDFPAAHQSQCSSPAPGSFRQRSGFLEVRRGNGCSQEGQARDQASRSRGRFVPPRRDRGEAENEEAVRCRLQGCNKPVHHPELGQRLCSRRHYYKSLCDDTERARAVLAAAVLASQLETAEGLGDSDEVTVLVVDYRWFAAIMILLVMVLMIALWLCVARRTTWTFSATVRLPRRLLPRQVRARTPTPHETLKS